MGGQLDWGPRAGPFAFAGPIGRGAPPEKIKNKNLKNKIYLFLKRGVLFLPPHKPTL
jgi:hypothetical protein